MQNATKISYIIVGLHYTKSEYWCLIKTEALTIQMEISLSLLCAGKQIFISDNCFVPNIWQNHGISMLNLVMLWEASIMGFNSIYSKTLIRVVPKSQWGGAMQVFIWNSHFETKAYETLFDCNLFLWYLIILAFCRAWHWYCHTLCKISKWLDTWNNVMHKWDFVGFQFWDRYSILPSPLGFYRKSMSHPITQKHLWLLPWPGKTHFKTTFHHMV